MAWSQPRNNQIFIWFQLWMQRALTTSIDTGHVIPCLAARPGRPITSSANSSYGICLSMLSPTRAIMNPAATTSPIAPATCSRPSPPLGLPSASLRIPPPPPPVMEGKRLSLYACCRSARSSQPNFFPCRYGGKKVAKVRDGVRLEGKVRRKKNWRAGPSQDRVELGQVCRWGMLGSFWVSLSCC